MMCFSEHAAVLDAAAIKSFLPHFKLKPVMLTGLLLSKIHFDLGKIRSFSKDKNN